MSIYYTTSFSVTKAFFQPELGKKKKGKGKKGKGKEKKGKKEKKGPVLPDPIGPLSGEKVKEIQGFFKVKKT